MSYQCVTANSNLVVTTFKFQHWCCQILIDIDVLTSVY